MLEANTFNNPSISSYQPGATGAKNGSGRLFAQGGHHAPTETETCAAALNSGSGGYLWNVFCDDITVHDNTALCGAVLAAGG